MVVRPLKGIYMFFMFAAFGLGILGALIFVFPVIAVIEKFKGHNPLRMQEVYKKLFAFWLQLMSIGGLLRSNPIKGKIYDGPCIIIANHPGLFDVLYLIRDIPQMSVLVKRSLAQQLPLAPLLRLSGYVLSPDNRSVSPVQSLQEAIDNLKMGLKFQLFPEGTRSPKEGLLPFHAGAFKIAQKLDIPIQPVLIRNTPPFMPKGEPWYFPPRQVSEIELEFWDPIQPPKKGGIRKVAKEVEDRYRKALGIDDFS